MKKWTFGDAVWLLLSFSGFICGIVALLVWALWQDTSNVVLRRLGFTALASRREESADEAFGELISIPED